MRKELRGAPFRCRGDGGRGSRKGRGTYIRGVLAGMVFMFLGMSSGSQVRGSRMNLTENQRDFEKDFQASGECFDGGWKASGSLRLAGSSSMERLASALAEGFMEEYPDVSVTIEYIGSAAGVEAVLNGSADIGNSSRYLKEEELARGAVEHVIAMDGIAVCVDPSNKVTGLSMEQLTEIYTGQITNWSNLGGENVPIVAVGHEAGSGTRDAFEYALGIRDKCVYANELNSMGAVKARAALIPGVIGYVSCEVVDDSVKVLPIDGVEPNAGNVADGSYPLYRPFVMVTKGDIKEQNELVQAWFSYVSRHTGNK